MVFLINKKKISYAIFFSSLLFSTAVGGFLFSQRSARQVEQDIRQQWIDLAKVAASAVNPGRIENLTVSEQDYVNPDFIRLKEQVELIDISLKERKILWAYIMVKKGDKIYFQVDSSPKDDPNYSPPGSTYDDAPPELFQVFNQGMEVSVGPYQDKWGSFVSAFVPVRDLKTKQIIAVFAIDVNASVLHEAVSVKKRDIALITGLMLLLEIIIFLYFFLKAKVETELKESVSRFSKVAEQSREVIWEVDKNGLFTYASPAAKTIFGYSPEELVNKFYFYDLYPSESRARAKQEFLNLFSNKEPFSSVEKIIKHRDGRLIYLSSSGFPETDSRGRLKGYLISDLDISDIKKNEQATLEKSRELALSQDAILNILEDVEVEKNLSQSLAKDLEKFKLAVAEASDQIIITDAEGIVLSANRGMEEITGFKAKEVIGKKAGTKEFWGGLMDLSFYEKLWQTIKINKKPFIGDINNKRKNGELYTVAASITPILNAKNEVEFFVAIERDITKEKQIDKAKTEFVSLASHQLRTPLSSVKWYSEILLAGDAGKLSVAQEQYLREVYQSNERMIDLVNSLLNVSRIDMGTLAIKIEPVDLRQLTDSVLAETIAMIKKKAINIKTVYDPKLATLPADSKLMRIVIQNLISNAIKYTPEKGAVEIKIGQDKTNINFSIKDNGFGIPEADQAKIFSKLFRAENVKEKETEGTGLGLYLVKAVVAYADGKIWFESIENKGTTFFVQLPLEGMKEKKGDKSLI